MLIARSSFSIPLLEKTLISTTVPLTPVGTLKLVSFKSDAFSQNISLNDIDDIIAFILKDTAYQMINDQSLNSDIKWLFNNDKNIS